VVGKLQPILAALPGKIRGAVLTGQGRSGLERSRITSDIEQEIDKAKESRFDLDEDTSIDFDAPPPPRAPLTLGDLKLVLNEPALYPEQVESSKLGSHERRYRMQGLAGEVRVTTDPAYYEEHPDSVELWSPGGAVFPAVTEYGPVPAAKSISELLVKWGHS
jgi:hypothetical protein